MNGSIEFSSVNIAHNFCDVPVHYKLTDVILWILVLTGEVVITSAKRLRAIHAKDSGIHLTGDSVKNPLRATDIRYYIYNDPDKLVNLINQNFIYDTRRKHLKVAVFHDTGHGRHIHLQVHERTKQIN
jgi:hypothetical protein